MSLVWVQSDVRIPFDSYKVSRGEEERKKGSLVRLGARVRGILLFTPSPLRVTLFTS